MKVGIFGGSFNPVQNGHLHKIKEILRKDLVDEVWFIPCKNHAFGKKLENEKHRLKMIQLAIGNNNKIKIKNIELKSKGKCFTFKTIKKLKRKYNHDFSLIIGEDILSELKEWYLVEEIFKEISWIILSRKKYEISSTKIRKRIKENKSIKGLVAKEVEEYIKLNNLYKNGL